MNATWKKIAFNVQNIQHETMNGVLIAMPHSSDHDGYKFWTSQKLVRQGRHSYERFLSVNEDMTFKLIKNGKGKFNKFEVIASKEITADELAEAFGGYVEKAPYTPYAAPEKEEIIYHKPSPLETVKIDADPSLTR